MRLREALMTNVSWFQTLIGILQTGYTKAKGWEKGASRFQTLIGILQTKTNVQAVRTETAVSNPYRYSTNIKQLLQKTFQKLRFKPL